MVAATSSNAVKFYNEWHDGDGRVRAHYEGLFDSTRALGGQRLAERWEQARRRVELDAVTFYLNPGQYRAMPTDFLPRVIPIDHWETIAAGVSQRIRAINRFLLEGV